jgi:hypothetical protein
LISSRVVDIGPLVFGAVFAVVALLAALALIPIIVIVANRAEPDARGVRPFSVYLFGMSFVALLLTYSGLSMIVTALLSFIGSHSSPIADSVGRECVIGALLLVIGGGTLSYHVRKGLVAARGDGRVDGPNARVQHSYIGAVSFLFVLQAIVSLGVAIYLIFQLAGPGIFGLAGGDRTTTLRVLLDFTYLLVASAGVVWLHWRWSPPGLLRSSAARATAPTAPET